MKKSSAVETGVEDSEEESLETPWYLNKWLVSIAVFFIGLAILKDSADSSSSSSGRYSNDSEQVSEESSSKTRFYNPGATVILDDMEVCLVSWDLKPNVRTGNQFTDIPREDGVQFLIMKVVYKNISQSTITLGNPGKVYLVLGEKEYVYDRNETILLEGWIILLKKLAPLNTFTVNLVFKIPQEQGIRLFWAPSKYHPDDIFILNE
ncbi:MAG: hypothetical protein JJT78_04580 [Leptospira sp.]|nr:hypothetical protein [Leptospira sp.]